MDIESILEEKRAELERLGNPLGITFTAEEINVLGDETNLRCFKLKHACPQNFKKADNIFTCFKEIVRDSSLYRVLEFCMLYNRVLARPVGEVIPQLARKY